MKPAPFSYAAPSTVDEACRLLDEAGGGAALLAGGQTLLPLLNLRMSQPFILIDINRIDGLQGISRQPGSIRIGAATRQADALDCAELAAGLPVLAQALGHVGHHQTRNRGTVGGSVALGEPAAELPATCVALGAVIEVQSVRGVRQVAARDFFLGPYLTVLEPDEMITAIAFPDWPAGHVALFREVAQRPGDFALVGLVGALVLEGGRIARAGIGWFGMGPVPVAARQVEAALTGMAVHDLDAAALADFALAECAPFDDHHASAEYRRTVARNVFASTLREALHMREAA